MPLRATCNSVDLLNLLSICLSQCRDKQEALSEGEIYDERLNSYEESEVNHGDIFEIEKSCKDSILCEVISQAFERAKVRDAEVARGCRLSYRAKY